VIWDSRISPAGFSVADVSAGSSASKPTMPTGLVHVCEPVSAATAVDRHSGELACAEVAPIAYDEMPFSRNRCPLISAGGLRSGLSGRVSCHVPE
jgi:hypothetical protein